MGKHKRKHAEMESVASAPEPDDDETAGVHVHDNVVDPEPETGLLPSKRLTRSKKKKHKSRSHDYASDVNGNEEPQSRSRSRSPAKSKRLLQNEPPHVLVLEDVHGESLISPQKPKKKKSHRDSQEQDVMNGHGGGYDQRMNSVRVVNNRRRQVEYTPEKVDPLITKVLNDMRKGLTDATVGDPGILAAEELETDDVEIFIIQCPENVDLLQLLENKKIKFGNDSITGLGSDSKNESYESVFLTDENEKTLTVVLPDALGNARVVSSTLSGHILIREAIDKLQVPALEVTPKSAHELPAGLKERHPVFGTDFTIPLKSLEYEPMHTDKTKSKKKKRRKSSGTEAEKPSEQVNSHYEDNPPITSGSKKHKHRLNGVIETVALEPEVVVEEVSRKKKKKSKRSRNEDSYQVNEVEMKSGFEQIVVEEVEVDTHKKHKRKKKDKKSLEESERDFQNLGRIGYQLL